MFSGQAFGIRGGDLNGKKKRVGVIGCGISGLVGLKTALEYGHDVVGFERLSDIGGIWNYKWEDTPEGYTDLPGDGDVPCYPMYKSLITNTSQYNTIFSDLMPTERSKDDYPCREEVSNYAKAYASHFRLLPYVKLESHVSRLHKSGGKWSVHYNHGNKEHVELFDFVMVCNGAFGFPRDYEIKGKEDFKGLILHSGQIRDGTKLFKDKRVFLIGGSISAGEVIKMALDNGVKKMSIHLTDREKSANVWVGERHVKSIYGDKRPADMCMNRENTLVHWIDVQTMFSQWFYPIQKCLPDARMNFPSDMLCLTDVRALNAARERGVVEIVQSIDRVNGNTVYLRNGDAVKNVDIIVVAKGFCRSFPFLDHIWAREEQNKYHLYNYMISPSPKLDGLAFMMMLYTPAPQFPMLELQCRWFVHKIVSRNYDALNEIYDVTERKHMEECIHEKLSRLPDNVPFTSVDNVFLLNEYMATDIGVNPPDFTKLIDSGDEGQIELGVALAYGPLCPMQFRIQGPHSWPKASEECVKLAKQFLGQQFYEYIEQVKQNNYPRSGLLDPSKGPYNVY